MIYWGWYYTKLFDKDKGYDCKCFLHIESSNFFKPNGFSTPGIHLCYRGTLKPSSEEWVIYNQEVIWIIWFQIYIVRKCWIKEVNI